MPRRGGAASKTMPCTFLSNLVVLGAVVHTMKHLLAHSKNPSPAQRDTEAVTADQAVKYDELCGTYIPFSHIPLHSTARARWQLLSPQTLKHKRSANFPAAQHLAEGKNRTKTQGKDSLQTQGRQSTGERQLPSLREAGTQTRASLSDGN